MCKFSASPRVVTSRVKYTLTDSFGPTACLSARSSIYHHRTRPYGNANSIRAMEWSVRACVCVCSPENKQINDTALFTRNARKSTNMENLWLFKIGFTFVKMCPRERVLAMRVRDGVTECAHALQMLWDTVSALYAILYHLSLPKRSSKAHELDLLLFGFFFK